MSSVRTKVLGSVLVMAALGMAVSEAAAYLVQSQRLDADLDAALRQEVSEFRTLAEVGVDPSTGDRFRGVEGLLETALARNVADDNETFLALVDGQPRFTPRGDRVVRLEQVPALLEQLQALPRDAPVELRSVGSPVGELRYAAVQVTLQDSPLVGTYVVAYAAEREREVLDDVARTYALVAVLSLLLLAVVGSLVVGRVLRPLSLLRAAAQRTAESAASGTAFQGPAGTEAIPVRGRDEVSDLTRSFNAMLERLRSAFDEQRQFLDDAGHELRTPVTILRGHLELLDPDDPAEVRETRTLLLDELDRTGRLVDDLVALAKAQRPDLLRPGPVHLGELTDEVLDKAVGLGDRDWHVDARADAVITADRQRLTQALLQLAANAVTATAPGAEVAVGSSVQDGTARLWVRDRGPGIDPADHERVFERFGRASRPGSARGTEGSGLGLAIVSALATAHGGTVELSSAPGLGSRFTLVLPAVPPEEGP